MYIRIIPKKTKKGYCREAGKGYRIRDRTNPFTSGGDVTENGERGLTEMQDFIHNLTDRQTDRLRRRRQKNTRRM